VPVPRCLAAVETGGGGWHLLLEDLSATHGQPEWPVPPPVGLCRGAVDALAALHAAWWEHPRLEADLGQPVTAAEATAGIATTTALVERFREFLGDRLTAAGQAAYARALAALPALWAWYGRRKAKSLCHGDAHAWNLLFPRRPDGPVYLCDWQTWRPGIGALDLATLMVLDWSPARRARLERDLVARYHARLGELGVRGYGWDACWRDYRWAALNALFTPPWRWDNGTAARYWWPHLEAALAAFEDLECAALVGPVPRPRLTRPA
jgi:aminoglycoside/choline kinase family phosphotransferase